MNPSTSSPSVASVPHLRRIGQLLVVASLLVIGFATLLPEDGNPIPSLCLICGTVGGVDAILNVLLFVPLGVGLAMSGVQAKLAIPGMAALSLSIELMQLVAIRGRDASLGDFLTNSGGGALGFALCLNASGWLRPSSRAAMRLATAWLIFWLGIQTAASFGFSPALPAGKYHGQIARALEIFAKFEGKVLSAKIGQEDVPDRAFVNSARVREQLEHNEPIVASVLPAQPTQDLAPIVRIADDEKREIALLAQDRRSLVFGVRTGAAVLRLRQPLFALHNVFPDSNSAAAIARNDPLRLRARYGPTKVELRSEDSSGYIAHSFLPGPALAWTLVAPTQWYIDGRSAETVLTLLWSLALILPLGYWMSCAIGARTERPRGGVHLLRSAILLAAVAIGLIVVPRAFALSPAALGVWIAVVAGIASGWALGECVSGWYFSHHDKSVEPRGADLR